MEPGFQEAGLGPPRPARAPRMLPAALDAADCPSVSLSSARENSMLAPSRRGPHPFTSHPPLPSWQGDGKRQLISSPHSACGRVLNSLRLITEHLISASPQRGGVGTPGSFCLLSSSQGCVLITNRQGHSLALLRLPPLRTLPLSCPLLTPSFPPFFPLPRGSPPTSVRIWDLILHTPLPVVLVSPEPRCPLCTSHSPWVRFSLAFSLYVFS